MNHLFQLLSAVGQIILILWVFFYLYVLIMGLYRAKLDKRLSKTAYALAIPALIIGYLLDLAVNWTIASVWFLKWPSSPLELVTGRLSGYLKDKDLGWRSDHAEWICVHLLDYFDPSGKHC